MNNYNRFDVDRNHGANGDPDAWMAAVMFLTFWGIIAVIAILETFTDLLG